MMGCWRGRLTEDGREAQQEEERLCYNLVPSIVSKGGGGRVSKSIGFGY